MTAFLVFTDSQPILVVASRTAVSGDRLADFLADKGVTKYIAHEVPLNHLRNTYGVALEVVESDIREGAAVRVLDSSGDRVFKKIHLSELEHPIRRDSATVGSMGGRLQESHV